MFELNLFIWKHIPQTVVWLESEADLTDFHRRSFFSDNDR